MLSVRNNIAYLSTIWLNEGVHCYLVAVCRRCLVRWFWEDSQARSVLGDSGQPEASAHCIGLTTEVRVRGQGFTVLCSPTKEKPDKRETHGSEGRRVAVDDAERMSSGFTPVTPSNGVLVDARNPLRLGPNVTSSKTVRIRQFIAGERRTPSAACKVDSLSHKLTKVTREGVCADSDNWSRGVGERTC